MKKHLNKLLVMAAGSVVLFSACQKEGTNVIFQGGTAPVLTASAAGSIPLSAGTAGNQAVAFTWTNPEYQFSDGRSSMNVTYNLEFDTVGANFTSPHMQTVQLTSDLTTSFTVVQLNSLIANGLQLDTVNTHNIEVRVVSFIAPYVSGSPSVSPLNSNSLAFEIKAYSPPPVVDPPSSGTLFLVGGDPKIGGWSNPVPASQQFTKVSNTDYQLKIDLSGGDPAASSANDQYLLLPVNGSWSHKYSCNSTSSQPFSGGTFGLDLSSNFPGPTAPGTYLIDVNFQTGIITVTKQ